MKRILWIFLVVASVLFCSAVTAADLKVYAGAGLIKPMEEMRTQFEAAHDCEVEVHYGSSGELFGLLSMGQPSDVFIPGAAKYTEDALKNGWIVKESIHNLVLHEPMIAVPQGNPAGIAGLEDLARAGVKVALGDPKGPAIGRVSKKLLTKNKLAARVDSNVTVFAPTVNQLLIYVALEQVDAAIIWGDLVTWAEGQGKVETVRIRPEKNIIMTIPTALTVQGRDNPLARAFNDLMGSPEGLAVWKKWGFEPCAG
jgi:molybdate transport system substrate-binding protein